MATATAAAAPAASGGPAPGALCIDRPVVRDFGDREPPELASYELAVMEGMLADFGLAPDPDRRDRGHGNCFAQMGAQLLDELDRPMPPPDLLVLAYHLPDLLVADVAACALIERCGTVETAGFSVSEQGVGSPFTALRIVSALRASGAATADDAGTGSGTGTAAVLVLDTSTSLYHDAEAHDVPIDDCAVLLRTDPREGEGAVLEFVDETAVDDLDAALRDLRRQHPAAQVVIGRTLAEHLDAGPHHAPGAAPTGTTRRLCTDAWAALAERWPLEQPTIVADYDPHAGRLFSAGFRPQPRPQPDPEPPR